MNLALAQLTWRQHRAVLITGLAWTLLVSGCLLAISDTSSLAGPVETVTIGGPTVLTLLVGLFLAAPLLPREYEQGTYVFAWGQDVTASRWLRLKVGYLLSAVLLMSVLISVLRDLRASPVSRPFSMPMFEGFAPVQVAYVAFAFALGLALGALTRRTLLAMGLTLVGFLVVRAFVAAVCRRFYLPPLHAANLEVMPRDSTAVGVQFGAGPHGIAGVDYQPNDRVPSFQWIETGLFLTLAAGLLVLAWWLVRRREVR
ncbi:hypothetical protein [Kutzneria albida]|uniref:ABC transporter permease n=1 Tax=Kutzneria albida DSM 43870 TaxID=1449976 RepID=W5WJC0_9PSEU|nr:hypothetical protein [Kutzneria albida]AHI01299.1 hypothetical protein KALB_7941 [Kutzneria albida DSM 43870]